MKHLRPLIHNGTIKIFSDLLDHVSVGELATAMGCGVKQVEAVRKDNGKIRLIELITLSEAIGLDYKRVSKLFVVVVKAQ
jgi:hypothetical protein